VLDESAGWYRYDLPQAFRAAARHKGFDGQVQKWFAMRFPGPDGKIDLNSAEPEFEALCRAPAGEVAGRAPPFRQALHRAVIEAFRGRVPAGGLADG
jgi:putative (di)nucleoside polyphosphate hydrolase